MGLFRNYYGKQKYKQYTRNGLIAMILIIVAVITLFPIYYMVISSFGAPTEAGGASYSLIPKSFSLDSYKFFFEYSEYSFRWILNSFIVAAVVTVSNVFFASLAGYAFAKLRFPGCRFFFFLLLVAMMVPYQVTQVPLYILVVNVLQMQDTYPALIAPTLVTCYNVFLAKQFFTSLPTSIIESAKIEGCSQPQIVWKIIMPLSKTILAVMAIMTFLGEWNTFFLAIFSVQFRANADHSGWAEELQFCKYHLLCTHDGGSYDFGITYVHLVLLFAEIFPGRCYSRCGQRLRI